MPETRQKLQLKGAAVSLYLPAVHPPLPPPIFPSNCSLVDYSPPREPRSNALPLFILSVRSVPLSRSRAILVEHLSFSLSPRSSYHRNILKSFVYSLLANRRRREIERREEGVSRKIYAFFASSRKKGDPRRYVPRVYEQGSPREREKGEIDFAGRNRPRRAIPSREREMARRRSRKKGDR